MAFKFRSQNNFMHRKAISLSANRRGRLVSTAIQYAHLLVCKKLTSFGTGRLQRIVIFNWKRIAQHLSTTPIFIDISYLVSFSD